MNNLLSFHYRFYYILFYFFIYSFIGWCIEIIYAARTKSEFVNRGFLYGPFCPIYGFAALALIIFLNPLKNNIILLIIGAFLLPSFVEYLTGFILEKAFNSTWWDYSGDKFNLHGRICLEFSIIWWLISLFVILIFQPLLVNLVTNIIPIHLGVIILYILITYLIFDFAITLSSLLKLKSLIIQLSKVSLELKAKSEAIKRLKEAISPTEFGQKFESIGQIVTGAVGSLSRKATTIVGKKVESLGQKVNGTLENLGEKIEITAHFVSGKLADKLGNTEENHSDFTKLEKLELKVEELKVTYDNLLNNIANNHSRIFKAFPGFKVKNINGPLTDIKNKVKSFKK